MAHFLVTGGAGFIGSHLTEELPRRGHRVRVADDLITGKRANLAHVSGVEFLQGDLADLAFARRAVAGVEFVLHQAAIPSVPRSVADPLTSHRANVDATLNVLLAARDAGVRRLVFAGSSSAYGNTRTLPKHEDMPTNPLSPYALQKVVGEQYLQMFTRLYGLETVTIRYFNVFGPRQDPSSPYSGVISVFATALLDEPRADDLRRRRADPRLHLRRQRRRRRAAGRARRRTSSGEVINVATGGRISLNQSVRHDADADRSGRHADYAAARRRRARLAGRHPQGRTLLGFEPDGLVRGRPAADRRCAPIAAPPQHRRRLVDSLSPPVRTSLSSSGQTAAFLVVSTV